MRRKRRKRRKKRTLLEDDEPDYDPWSPLRKEVGKDIEEPYMKQFQRFMDKGKIQTFAENAAFITLLPLSRRRLRRIYLQHQEPCS